MIIILEDTIPKIQFVRVSTVHIQKEQQKNNSTE